MRVAVMNLTVLIILCACPAIAGECKLEKITTVPLSAQGNLPIIDVAINETPGRIVVDSGAKFTMLDTDYASKANVNLDSRVHKKTMVNANGDFLRGAEAHARHIQIGDISFNDWLFWVRPNRFPVSPSIDGRLGRDFLHLLDIEFDYKEGELSLWCAINCRTLQPAWTGDYDSIPLKVQKRFVATVTIAFDSVLLDLELETTKGDQFTITQKAATAVGVTDAQLATDPQISGEDDPDETANVLHKFKMLQAGNGEFPGAEGVVIRKVNSRVEPFSGADGSIGIGRYAPDRA